MDQPGKAFVEKIESRLRFIYGQTYSEEILNKLLKIISNYPKQKPAGEKWDETDTVLITYGDSIKTEKEAPLQTLYFFLKEKLQEQFSVVHILPFFPYSSDDGFSVIDFRRVNPELGDWNDIEKLTGDFDLMTDLVINHVSSKSEWFQNFLKQEGKGKDFFICEDPASNLSEVTRPRSSPLLTPCETANGVKYVWTTFSADQIDLNFSNPEVLLEMIDILLTYIEKGTRIIRLDAIAFLWKKVGTTCLHLSKTHEVVKLIRDVAELINQRTIILTETNVPNRENLSYFGNNDEAHMVYQFSLPPLLLHALHTGNPVWLSTWAQSLPQLDGNKTFFNFTASHDGIGVRPLEGLLPNDELNKLVENMQKFGGKVNFKSNPDGITSPYELNITYFDALKGTVHGEDQLQVERFLASQIVMMSFAGVPAFYIHSLTATHNYLEGLAKTRKNRTINRKKWNLEELNSLLSNETKHQRVFNSLKRLIKLRKKQKAFHPNASQEIFNPGNGLFGLIRESDQQTLILIANLTNQETTFELPLSFSTFQYDLILNQKIENHRLKPYQCAWLVHQ